MGDLKGAKYLCWNKEKISLCRYLYKPNNESQIH